MDAGASRDDAFDVIVIGAGVAGQAAIRTLMRLGARVAWVDRRFPVLEDRRGAEDRPEPGSVEEFSGTARLAGPGRVEVTGGAGVTLRARAVLLATGACVTGLGLDGLGVERDPDGFLRVDDRCRTRVPGLFAAGDVTGPPFTAEKAEEEAEVAALAAMGKPTRRFRF